MSEKAFKTLYYLLIHCHLVYGIHIWSSTTVSNLNDLRVKQKNAIRTITLSKYNAHTLPLFKTLKILPLDSLIYFFKLQFMSKYVQNYYLFHLIMSGLRERSGERKIFQSRYPIGKIFIFWHHSSLKPNVTHIFCSLNYGANFPTMT